MGKHHATICEQAHIVSTLVFERSKDEYLHLQAAMLWYLRLIDEHLANRVAAGLAFARMHHALVTATPVPETAPTKPCFLPRPSRVNGT